MRQRKHPTHNKQKNNGLRNEIRRHIYLKYISHVCRCPNNVLTKKMLFVKSKRPYQRDPWINIAKLLHIYFEQAKRSTGWFHYIGSE